MSHFLCRTGALSVTLRKAIVAAYADFLPCCHTFLRFSIAYNGLEGI